jgi:1-phosphatidylinositol-4-phosphate 5-kinase
MDYSLLVGIHDLSRGNEDKLRDKTLRVFQPGGDKGEESHVSTTNSTQLMRTPSKLETQRKAKELRETLIKEKPIPMDQAASRMPDEMAEGQQRRDFQFYSDDGGFRATHENNAPGEYIYYLGIIDCLTHVSLTGLGLWFIVLTKPKVWHHEALRTLFQRAVAGRKPNLCDTT